MRLEDNTGRVRIKNAIQLAEKLLSPNSKMMDELIQKNDFKYNSGSGVAVALELQAIPPWPVNVYTYTKKGTKAIGYAELHKGIFVNTECLSWVSDPQLVGLMIHEWSHFRGYSHGSWPFGNFKTEEKCKYSVPYFCSENVSRWL